MTYLLSHLVKWYTHEVVTVNHEFTISIQCHLMVPFIAQNIKTFINLFLKINNV